MTEDEFEKGKDILLKNENVENILENEQIKHYTDKIASNEYVEKYSKNFIKNAHTIKELGEEKFFNEENDLKEIDVILVDDKNKKVQSVEKERQGKKKARRVFLDIYHRREDTYKLKTKASFTTQKYRKKVRV